VVNLIVSSKRAAVIFGTHPLGKHSTNGYEFAPNVIEVPAKTLVRIHLKALDKEHGFELKDFKDSCIRFKLQEPVMVEVYADKTGEYEFVCCKFCGLGHGEMKGKLVVK
jgi:cytochrome c oxidase subunit II